MFLKCLKTLIIFSVLYVGIAFLAKPQILNDLQNTRSNEEVERLVTERWNKTRHNPFVRSSFFRGANMAYHGSKTVGLREQSYLGKYVFVRGYNSVTGEIDLNKTKFVPSVFESVTAFLIFVLIYWWLLPTLRRRERTED